MKSIAKRPGQIFAKNFWDRSEKWGMGSRETEASKKTRTRLDESPFPVPRFAAPTSDFVFLRPQRNLPWAACATLRVTHPFYVGVFNQLEIRL